MKLALFCANIIILKYFRDCSKSAKTCSMKRGSKETLWYRTVGYTIEIDMVYDKLC